MSARASGQVWKLSRHKGGELLVLLAIADNAKDDGRDAWPGIPELAKKTRLTERNIQLVLRKLEASGELVIEKNAGPHRCNLYHITLWGEKITPSDGEEIAPVKSFQGEIQRTPMVKSSAQIPAIPPTPPYKEELINVTVSEPSVRAVPAKPKQNLATFQPSEKERGDAIDEYGVPEERIAFETEQWRDYHAERGTTIKDFAASWRRWMRNHDKYGGSGRTSPAANGRRPTPIRSQAPPEIEAHWSDVTSEARRWHPGERAPTFVQPVMSAISALGGWEEFVRSGAKRDLFENAYREVTA